MESSPLPAILISEHPDLEGEVRDTLMRIRIHATKPCHGRYDSSSDTCSWCESRLRCAAKQGNPRLEVHIVEAEVVLRLGGGRR